MAASFFRILLLVGVMGALSPLPAAEAASDQLLITLILRHDQSKTVDEIKEHLTKTGFWKKFPPEGVEVVSYNIVMGIGHVITLKLPPDKLRALNLAVEQGAWGAFRSEFYPTYDYKPIFEEIKKKP